MSTLIPAVLELEAAALAEATSLPPMSLRLAAGELALIEAPEPSLAAAFADLAAGLLPAASGAVRFLGLDWAELTRDSASALRARIGRVFGDGGWIAHLDVATNVILPALHHTSRSEERLRERAAELAMQFGLPGLPLSRPAQLPRADLARAACVRALLGEPRLLLLESPLQRGVMLELERPLLDACARLRRGGGAVIWLTQTAAIWNDPAIPAAHRLRLSDHGLARAARAVA
jgi:phospholipid/cholesterol/gamma-HCH transport system ATP-binding protein